MLLAYRFTLYCYKFIVLLLSPFKTKAHKAIFQRKASLKALQKALKSEKSEITWFHASSLGEFEQGLPLMEAYKSEHPHVKLLVTFFSPSGYDLRKDHPIADYTAYLPWDSPSNARAFVSALHLKAVFFIKYEYWYFHLRAIKNKSIPLYSISALFVPAHPFFKWYGGLNRKMLHFFDHTFVQNESSLKLLQTIGIDKASVAGDTRFDKVSQTIEQAQPIDLIALFKADKELLIIGSAWSEDMEVLNDFLKQLPDGFKVLIAPHDIDKVNITKITKGLSSAPLYFSDGQINAKAQFMVLDTIGQLAAAYQYADMAYIGGAFGDGLHNILEAVAFGAPVVFGNQGLEKFPEAGELKQKGGAFAISNKQEASEILNRLTDNKAFRKECATACLAYIAEKRGATEVIMSHVKEANEG